MNKTTVEDLHCQSTNNLIWVDTQSVPRKKHFSSEKEDIINEADLLCEAIGKQKLALLEHLP